MTDGGGITGTLIEAAAYIVVLGALFLGVYFFPFKDEI